MTAAEVRPRESQIVTERDEQCGTGWYIELPNLPVHTQLNTHASAPGGRSLREGVEFGFRS
jgi:hypothetical protein